MTRPLGSFNRRVNLPSHPEDRQVSKQPRMAKLHQDTVPEDRVSSKTGGQAFAASRGRRPASANQRFAGNALNVDLSAGQDVKNSSGMRAAFAPPLLGGAENRSSTVNYGPTAEQ